MNGPQRGPRGGPASLAQSGVLDPQSSRWAVGEMARTMGFPISDPPPAGPVQSGMAAVAVLGSDPGTATGSTARLPGGNRRVPTAAGSFRPHPHHRQARRPSRLPLPSRRCRSRQRSRPTGSSGTHPTGCPPTVPRRGAPPSGSSSPGGTPPRPAPAGPRRRGRPPIALIVAAIVVVLLVVYFGAAATAGFFPFGAAARVATTPTPAPAPTFTSTPTIAPSSSPTAKPSSSGSPAATGSPSLSPLAGLLPSYVTGNTADSCSPVPTSDELASGVSAEELCDLTESQDAEDYVLYVGFPTRAWPPPTSTPCSPAMA